MKNFAVFLIFSLFTILSSCSSISVTYDYSPDTDFSALKTFRLFDDPIKGDALSQNPLIKKRVLTSLKNNLEAKGYTLDESDDADFVVVAHAGLKDRMQVTNWGSNYGWGWYGPGWGTYGHTDVTYYEEANLIVDIVDAERKELAWRGVATKTLEDPSPEKMQQKADEIIAKVMKNFPPPAK
jgi:hypothetical protein